MRYSKVRSDSSPTPTPYPDPGDIGTGWSGRKRESPIALATVSGGQVQAAV